MRARQGAGGLLSPLAVILIALTWNNHLSITSLDKIDFVTKKDGVYSLIILANENWKDTYDFLFLLEGKINNYATYFCNGQMLENYQDQNRITIRIFSTREIPSGAILFLEKLASALEKHNIDIEAETI